MNAEDNDIYDDDDTRVPEGEGLLDDLFADALNTDDYHADILLSPQEEGGRTEVVTKAKDAKGHEHRGKGKGGGQFVSQAEEGAPSGTKGKGKDVKRGGKQALKDKGKDKSVTINADLTPYEKGDGATYKTREINKHVEKKHGKHFSDPGQTTENEKAAKRVSTKKKGAYISPNQYLLLKQKAASKIEHIANHEDHVPTKQEIKEAKEGIKEYGGTNAYRKTLNGNSKDRRNRKIALAAEFGDGKRCGCVYCGIVISYSPKHSSQPMDEDKIHDTASGGKYKHQNLLPACIPCNRGDKKAKNSLQFLQSSTYGQTHLPSSPDNPKFKEKK